MGTEGEGISLDLGIGSSVDPLHLSEVDFYRGQPEKDTPDLKRIGATRVRSVACGSGNLLFCSRPLDVGGNQLLL